MSGMRKRTAPFVQVSSKTVNNPDLSLRSIGLLAWLLDKPSGWDVRSEAIAKKTKEGRDAIRKALHELGAVGHYRIERRHMLTGQFEMGTALSYDPDPDWAAQYAEYDGKPVPMVEQSDGSFKVKRRDGSLTDDGFAGDVSAGHTEDGLSVPGEPGAGFPAPGDAASGDPTFGGVGPITRSNNEENETETESSTSDDSAPGGQPMLIAVESATGGASSTRATGSDEQQAADAARIADDWWKYFTEHHGPITKRGKSSPFLGLRDNVIRPALAAGYTETDIKRALLRTGDRDVPDPVPNVQQFQRALSAARNNVPVNGTSRANNVHQLAPDSADHETLVQAFNG